MVYVGDIGVSVIRALDRFPSSALRSGAAASAARLPAPLPSKLAAEQELQNHPQTLISHSWHGLTLFLLLEGLSLINI